MGLLYDSPADDLCRALSVFPTFSEPLLHLFTHFPYHFLHVFTHFPYHFYRQNRRFGRFLTDYLADLQGRLEERFEERYLFDEQRNTAPPMQKSTYLCDVLVHMRTVWKASESYIDERAVPTLTTYLRHFLLFDDRFEELLFFEDLRHDICVNVFPTKVRVNI